jgi:formamidopyrimidine-DNA glycosylase
MPELPEVETVVRDLNRKIRGRVFARVWSDWPKSIKDPFDQRKARIPHNHVQVFERSLRGERVLRVERRGKNILIYLSHEKLLLIHQKMTGHLLVGKWQLKDNKLIPISPEAVVRDSYNYHIHLLFYFKDGTMMGFSDVRKFGKAILGDRKVIESLPELTELGPEPLQSTFTFKLFSERIKARPGKIKQVLLDQTVIAGIGNIYSDDILWQAKIHPLRRASTLTLLELKRLYQATKSILSKAVRFRGTSTSDFRDTAGKEGAYTGYRRVYQRKGKPCYRCRTPIQRMVVGARSAHFCPTCQQLL